MISCSISRCQLQASTSGRGPAQHPVLSRRQGIILLSGLAGLIRVSPLKSEEDALYAVGEINSTLNACPLNSKACVSTQNDDEAHFIPPWQYDGDPAAAIQRLIEVATGGQLESGLLEGAPGLPGISRTDVAAFIVEGVGNTLRGERLPERPARRKAAASVPLDGILADRHTTEDGSEYIHIIFSKGREPAAVIDAEFVFLSGDNIVDIRAGSRGRPGLQDAQLGLSFTQGLAYDSNTAKRRMEDLRKALQWETAPVLTDFDPRYNNKRLLWFERLYQPFLGRDLKVEEEPIYDK